MDDPLVRCTDCDKLCQPWPENNNPTMPVCSWCYYQNRNSQWKEELDNDLRTNNLVVRSHRLH